MTRYQKGVASLLIGFIFFVPYLMKLQRTFAAIGLSAVPALAYNKSACQPGPHLITNPSPNADPHAPDTFQVQWQTTAGSEPIVIEAIREWSPLGVDRFYQLVLDNYYDCAAFFRVVPDFVVQFGIAADPDETAKWNTNIPDDPVIESNVYGTVSFAMAGPNTRTTQLFINTANNTRLDADGFAPIGRVLSGMSTVLAIDNPTPGDSSGVNQDHYTNKGNQWILEEYPDVDLIKNRPNEERRRRSLRQRS